MREPPRGDYSVAEPTRTYHHVNIKSGEMVARWLAPDGEQEMLWHVEGGRWVDQTFTLPATYAGEEGTFDLLLNFRVDDSFPVRLIHNETLARQHSFNVSFSADPTFTNATVDRILEVDGNASWLDAETWDASRRDVSGRFHIEFTGVCEESCPDVEDPEPVHVVLEGRFPKPKH